MKKISSILILTLLLTFITPVITFGAEISTLEKFDILKALKIINGVSDGSAALDEYMDRAQLAAILVRIYKLPIVTSDQGFFDVSRSHWAQKEGIIGAVVRAGYMQGTGDRPKIFSPNNNLTYAEIAVVLARVLNLKLEGRADGAPAWAAAEIKAVVDAGLMRSRYNYNSFATRGDLIEAAYAIYLRTLIVDNLVVKNVELSNAKEFKVTFNKGIEDTRKLQFTIIRGSTNISFSTRYNNARTEATLDPNSNLSTGDYTISIKYDSILLGTFTVKVEGDVISEILFVNDKLERIDQVTGYATVYIRNQYGEIINNSSLAKNIVWSVYPSSSVDRSKIADGLLYVTYGTKNNTNTGTQLKDLSKVVVTATHPNYGLILSQELQVTQSQLGVATFNFGNLRDQDGKVVNSINAKVGAEYTFDYTAIDINGNRITDYDLINNGSLQLFNTHPDLLTVAIIKGKNNTAVIRLTVKKANSATVGITGYSGITGRSDTKNLLMETPDAKLAKFNLIGPVKDVIAGEKVEISYKAVDAKGRTLIKYSDIQGRVNITASNGVVTEERTNEGAYKLYILFNRSGRQYVTANVGNEVSNIYVDVKAAVEYRDVKIELEQGTTMITKESQKVIVKAIDQYGREREGIGSFDDDKTEVKSDNPDFPIVKQSDGIYRVTASSGKTGEVNLIALLKNSSNQVIDTATITLQVVNKDDVVDFTLLGLEKTIYASGKADAYSANLNLTGKLSNGTLVYLGARSVEFIKSIELENNDAFVLDSSTHRIYAKREATTQVNVTINNTNEEILLTAELKSSSSAPVATKITGQDTTLKYNKTKGLKLVDAQLFKIEDSYGIDSVMKPIYVDVNTKKLMDIRNNKKVIAYVDNNGALQFKYEDNSAVSSSANVEGTVELTAITHNEKRATITLTIEKN